MQVLYIHSHWYISHWHTTVSPTNFWQQLVIFTIFLAIKKNKQQKKKSKKVSNVPCSQSCLASVFFFFSTLDAISIRIWKKLAVAGCFFPLIPSLIHIFMIIRTLKFWPKYQVFFFFSLNFCKYWIEYDCGFRLWRMRK